MNLEQKAELLKLSRAVGVQPQDLDMLDGVDALSLRQLRERVNDAFHAGDAPMFKRMVSASKLLPLPALALIAEKLLSPLLVARLSGLMDVERGLGIARRLPDAFLADVCLHLDTRASAALIRAIPQKRIVAVAKVLVSRAEHVAMGQFVDVLSEAVLLAVINEIDDADLLSTAFFAEDKSRLDSLVRKLDTARLESVIRCAASDADLWPEAIGLMQHLSPDVRASLANLAASMDESILTSMVNSIQAGDLWVDALPIVAEMNTESKTRFANLPAIQQPSMLLDIIAIAGRERLWGMVLPLVDLMDENGRNRTAAVAGKLDGEQLLLLARGASECEAWPTVIDLARRIEEPARSEIIALLGMVPDTVADALLPAAEKTKAWDLLEASLPLMGSGARNRLHAAADRAGLSHRLPA